MNLFEKVEEFRSLDEKVKKLDEEIRKDILTKFVNLRYQIKEVVVGYLRYRGEEQDKKVKVYYPILDLPEGFSKKDDEFFREYSNAMVHRYTLMDAKGKEVKVEEIISFNNIIYVNDECTMMVNNYMFKGDISYRINVSETIYNFCREITYKEMLEQLLEDKEVRFTCVDTQKLYRSEEDAYEEYLKALGKTGDIISLKELAESPQDEIQITPTLLAKISIKREEKSEIVLLETPKISVRIDNAPYIKNIIQLQVQTKTGIKLNSKEFNYFELKDVDKFEKGMTLQELFEMYC